MSQLQNHKHQKVKVANPQAGGASVVSYSRAMRYVRRGKAKIRANGTLEFLYDTVDDEIDSRRKRNIQNGAQLMVSEYSGIDAFPGRAVMPPSPSVLRNMGAYRGPVRPPLMKGASV